MPRIEDYGLIGDLLTAGLVSRAGSLDWLCLPRFDAGACFAALLGTAEHGRWLLAPAGEPRPTTRRYRDGTLVLETDHETPEGAVRVIEFMPPRTREPDVVRLVVGLRGRVRMRMELVIRFDYGSIVPWVRRLDGGICAVAGPDTVVVRSPVPMHGENMRTVADFDVAEGERVPFVLAWHPSHERPPDPVDAEELLHSTDEWWRRWSTRCRYQGPWRDAVIRSLVTLKALTYDPTGAVVAAATTSLPEQIGGARNWDYRFCWLRDATFTLYALMTAGYEQEARAWREWLLRAVAGTPGQLQIMYGIAGERRLGETELDWLPGYEGSRPVRVGNLACRQLQLDVFGELMDALHVARRVGLEPDANAWQVQRVLLDHLESTWQQPDDGLWEVRGPRRHFTHSKVMAWVALDRAVKAVERFGQEGPLQRWRSLRAAIHDEVCRRGFDAERGAFVQSYGSKALDASALMFPLVGFLPVADPRMAGTIAAIERELMVDGFVRRYRTDTEVDGLPAGEGAFLLCSFWLADNLALLGRAGEARALFERLLALRNDVGLLAEEYDPRAARLLGNFPQAFSHVALVNTATNLTRSGAPAEHRAER
jgi:GH15 family glucan-1,4-alpha-glucosidase